MTGRQAAACLAVIFNLSLLHVLGCAESNEARTARLGREHRERMNAEKNRLLSQYPSAVDFSTFAESFSDQYTVNLQDSIRNKPEQIYWIVVPAMDVVRRGESMRVEFTDWVGGTSMFSLNCPEKFYAAIKSDPRATRLDTYLVVFTLKAVAPTQLELRGEQNGEDISVTLDSDIDARALTGRAVDIRRVSDPEEDKK
jgi:hypothetical protein